MVQSGDHGLYDYAHNSAKLPKVFSPQFLFYALNFNPQFFQVLHIQGFQLISLFLSFFFFSLFFFFFVNNSVRESSWKWPLSVRGHLKLSEGYRSKLRSAAIVQQGEKVEGCKSTGDSNSSLPSLVGKGGFFLF